MAMTERPVPEAERPAPMTERPAPEATKLLAYWMEWERGETPPGRVISNLKTGGLRQLLEGLVAGPSGGPATDDVAAASPSPGQP